MSARWVLLCASLTAACGSDGSEYVTVTRGALKVTLTEDGESQAVSYKIVASPWVHWKYGRSKITELAEEGSTVTKGSVIGRIANSAVAKAVGEKAIELAQEEAELKKLDVKQTSDRGKLRAELLGAESALKLALIDTQRVRFESEAKRSIKRLEFDRARMRTDKVRRSVESRRVIHREERAIQLEKIRQVRFDLESAEATVERLALIAPADGMVEYRKNRRTRNKISVGDQVYPGYPLLGLPDLSRMKARTQVNETDIRKVFIGQKAEVRLDAYPRQAFSGEVISISKISKKPSKEATSKVFDVYVLLDGADEILKPGMTVSCELLVASVEDGLLVDSACLRNEGGEFVVYVKGLFGVRRVVVEVEVRDARFAVVRGDLKEGDRVVIRRSTLARMPSGTGSET